MDRAIVLTYHNIGKAPKGARLPGLYVSPSAFRLQMRYLKASGLSVVSLDEIVRFLNGQSEVRRPVALTFDDGFQDFYDNAWAELRHLKLPATVFVVTERAGGENLWDCEYLNARKKLMNWDSIMRIKDEGATIASHTLTHPSLTAHQGEALRAEIFSSKTALEEKINQQVDYFCYPYGDYNGEVVGMVKDAGYKAAFTTQKGCIFEADNPYTLKRISVKSTTGPLAFAYKLHLYNSGPSRRKRQQ
ncbi:MAG: polysaccharide deacetylase family protein [Nitrospirae bacterium]|nr:polysaccharide deacetylase family protein [Nitrospirota bacterium]